MACCYTWKIPKYSELFKDVDAFESGIFFGGVEGDLLASWQLRLYRGYNTVSVHLYYVRGNYAALSVSVNSWFVKLNGRKINECQRKLELDLVNSNHGLLIQTFWTRECMINEHVLGLADDTLTFECEIKSVETKGHPLYTWTGPNDHSMSRFGLMYKQKKLTDVTIAVGSEEFHLHKFILAAYSPVFAAMFEHDLKENKLSRIEIEDFDKETVETFIDYMYTGECAYSKFESRAKELITFSEKYDIKELKLKCEPIVAEKLEVDNAAELLLFADLHRADWLKKRIFDFARLNMNQIVSNSSWKALPKSFLEEFLVHLA